MDRWVRGSSKLWLLDMFWWVRWTPEAAATLSSLLFSFCTGRQGTFLSCGGGLALHGLHPQLHTWSATKESPLKSAQREVREGWWGRGETWTSAFANTVECCKPCKLSKWHTFNMPVVSTASHVQQHKHIHHHYHHQDMHTFSSMYLSYKLIINLSSCCRTFEPLETTI